MCQKDLTIHFAKNYMEYKMNNKNNFQFISPAKIETYKVSKLREQGKLISLVILKNI
jgi:hypothetical protein